MIFCATLTTSCMSWWEKIEKPNFLNVVRFVMINTKSDSQLGDDVFSSFIYISTFKVVMAVYQMHQAASLDLVSNNVLRQLQFWMSFSPKGLDVRFFVLRRSAPSTLGAKKETQCCEVRTYVSRNIQLFWCCHLMGGILRLQNFVILANLDPNAITCDLSRGLTKLDKPWKN